jgi:hypothetical protein
MGSSRCLYAWSELGRGRLYRRRGGPADLVSVLLHRGSKYLPRREGKRGPSSGTR